MDIEKYPQESIDLDLTKSQFIGLVCKYAGKDTPQVAAQWLDAIIEVIIREVYAVGRCRVPYLGTFNRKVIGAYVKTAKVNGEETLTRVPEKYSAYFTPSADFIDDINMHGISAKYKKKVALGKFTRRDWLRQVRAAELEIEYTINKDSIEKMQKNFANKIKEKVEKANIANENIKNAEEKKWLGRYPKSIEESKDNGTT